MKGLLMEEHLFHKTTEGVKTATRRLGSLGKMPQGATLIYDNHTNRIYPHWNTNDVKDDLGNSYKPRFNEGEIVFVKEPTYNFGNGVMYYRYRGDGAKNMSWANKMFMPESDARLKIEILDVYAQRLQDMSEEDAIKEGVEINNGKFKDYSKYKDKYPRYFKNPIESYMSLFARINGVDSWESNPFVWVYEYRIHEFKK